MNMTTSNYGLLSGLFYIVLGTLLSVSVPSFVHAEGPVIRSGETVGVEANQVLEGDFYGLGQTITISGEATRDVYALGGAVTLNAPVQEDLVIVGGVVQVHGEVKDDIRVIGGEVVIAEPVTDDVVILGGTVHILSTASIGGDLIFFGGEIRIDGPVKGAVYGTGNTVRIDALVEGDVTVRASESVTLGDNAEIAGTINYTSDAELVRAQGAVVTGAITRDSLFLKEDVQSFEPLILNILILVFSSLTVFFLAKSRINPIITMIFTGYGRLGLIGLGMLVSLPIIAVILMASVIGLIVGLALLLSYVVLVAFSFMCLPIIIGALVQRLTRLGDSVTIFTVIIGVFVTLFIPFVPIVGGFLLFLGLVVTIGALCSELYRFFKTS